MKRDTNTRITLYIEELVLHGVAAGARHAIAAAIERELEALVTAHGLPPALAQPGEHARLDAGSLRLSDTAPPQVTGARIAGAVYGGLAR